MAQKAFATITIAQLLEMFEVEQPNNGHRDKGYALVDVLAPERFEREHIPGSINIPEGREDEFERRFAKDKEIILYDDSLACEASTQVARELARRGFHRVKDYEEGLQEWKARKKLVHGTSAQYHE
ncbi:MAG: rhodanese-like domain-containing protein [Pseudomonadota bacterium]|nr:rhodanese-like domain-containing protein [Pseudomonadota bacterium]